MWQARNSCLAHDGAEDARGNARASHFGERAKLRFILGAAKTALPVLFAHQEILVCSAPERFQD